VQPIRTRWLWRGWLPLGALSLLVGHPGYGKSTLANLLAAETSRGLLNGDLAADPSNVLIASYEDHIAARLRPMLQAADADLDRVHFLHCRETGYVLDVVGQLGAIEVHARETGARLLIVDPLVAGLPVGGIDTHRDQSVRAALAPMAAMAERLDLAVLATMHLSKGAQSALVGAGGSIGFAGAARSILIFGVDPKDERGAKGPARVLAHAKSNLGRMQESLAVSILGTEFSWGNVEIETSTAIMGDASETQADDLVRIGGQEQAPRARAIKWLRELLADGKHRASEVRELAADDGIAKNTLERAKQDLGIEPFQTWEEEEVTDDKTGQREVRRRNVWWWQLPDEPEGEDDLDDEIGGDDVPF
jgi:hypothetical protein